MVCFSFFISTIFDWFIDFKIYECNQSVVRNCGSTAHPPRAFPLAFTFEMLLRKATVLNLWRLIAKEKEHLDNLNNLKLRSLRFRETRALGVRNPSRLHQNDREIWKRNCRMRFEPEIQATNEKLREIRREKVKYVNVLTCYPRLEVNNNRTLEAIIYLKLHSRWYGSAILKIVPNGGTARRVQSRAN